jgi:hypothetical protein
VVSVAKKSSSLRPSRPLRLCGENRSLFAPFEMSPATRRSVSIRENPWLNRVLLFREDPWFGSFWFFVYFVPVRGQFCFLWFLNRKKIREICEIRG